MPFMWSLSRRIRSNSVSLTLARPRAAVKSTAGLLDSAVEVHGPSGWPAAATMPIFSPSLFRLGNFRRLWTAMVLNSVGMMGETVVLGWLTLELTNSPFLVGVAMGARALPLFFVGVPAGDVADRFPRHRLMMLTGAGPALCAAHPRHPDLFGLARFQGPSVLLTFAAGMIRGVEQAARQSYTHDVVGAARADERPRRPRRWRCARAGSWARSAPAAVIAHLRWVRVPRRRPSATSRVPPRSSARRRRRATPRTPGG